MASNAAKVGAGVSAAVLLAAGHKRCPHCEAVKPFTAFNRNRCRPDGLQDRCRDCRKTAYWDNADAARESAARWRKDNPDRYAETYARWVARNKDRVRRKAAERARRYRQSPTYRLKQSVYTSMSGLARGRASSTKLEILGYTAGELRAHLERQFTRGMSWDNYGEWHIDHIVPLASFGITSLDDPNFKRAWALTNLRPLWAKENVAKGARREFLL